MTTTAARRAARDNMIEGQLRACEVLDESVLAGYLALARDEFAPAAWGDLAFADAEIPLSDSAAMLAPKLEARMLQEMALCGGERILQIGVGGGYLAALAAALCAPGRVVAVEIDPALAAFARDNLERAKIDNVDIEIGDGARGWPPPPAKAAPIYDAVVLTASTPILAPRILESVKPGGRVVAVVGAAPAMSLRRFDKTEAGVLTTNILETSLAPLRNAPHPPKFEF